MSFEDTIYNNYKELGVAIIQSALVDYKTNYRYYLRKGGSKPNRHELVHNKWLDYLMELCGIHLTMEEAINIIEARIESEERK